MIEASVEYRDDCVRVEEKQESVGPFELEINGQPRLVMEAEGMMATVVAMDDGSLSQRISLVMFDGPLALMVSLSRGNLLSLAASLAKAAEGLPAEAAN